MTKKDFDKIKEISVDEMKSLDYDDYIVVDIRDERAFAYGSINGAVNIPQNKIDEKLDTLPKDKLLIICCKNGTFSKPTAEKLREKEFCAVNLVNGYYGYMLNESEVDADRSKDVERSINKKFHKQIWSRFTAALNDYKLIEEGDKIAVCISGGKDSMLMAKLFQELKRHNKFPFEVVFLVMDPGYSPENREIIERNAKLLNVPITVFESNIFESVLHIEKSPCYLCARMRRGYLYNKAKELGCNKIALGHHYDDVIETVLMGMLYGGQVQTMMPKLHSTNFDGMELIRPMYLIREDDIKRWRDYNNLHFIQCACKFTEECASDDFETTSKRQEIKNLIREMAKINPQVESNIFRSVENVNVNTVIAYKKDGVKHNFLESYDD
ncbi:ATP-binding protein [uncultured Eubacterium sp.]|uniref:ATP-binding protein n=1 Tax=uncultured Eubacterium sp. TaxID=165185 RepID=UPI0028061137|nr:ATP-binding protein [uncultured Eubacterium sp.]